MKLKKNPLFKGLSNSLKDPKRFEEVEKELAEIIKSDHQHKTVKSYVTCAWCNERRQKRQDAMKRLGFKSLKQYLEWKKIHAMMFEVRKIQHEENNKETEGSKN